MKAEFTAIIDSAPAGGYWAIRPEVPGANGQGETARPETVTATLGPLTERVGIPFSGKPDSTGTITGP